MEKQKKYYQETEHRLQSNDIKEVLDTIKDIRKTGHAYVLPLLFQVANENPNQQVQSEIFQLLGQVKEKECVDYMVKEIESGKSEKNLSKLITTCWQSGLDYSEHVLLFTKQFIKGDYVTAIEAFSVIEEWIHNANKKDIHSCKNYLIGSVSDVSEDKKALYSELVKLIESYV